MSLKIGSLFTGSGMLDEAVRQVLGGEVVWCSEFEPATEKNPNPTQAAARLLAYRYPDVPNLGDISAVDWATVEPVDVLTGGFPCQDVSHAGRRAGLKAGTRSGLWARMCDAIETLRPRLVVAENVRGLLSAEADSDLAAGSGLLGTADGGTPLRALGRVLADLADLGYDTRWYGLRASDVGACHGRFRVFILAADNSGSRREGCAGEHRREPDARGSDPRLQAERRREARQGSIPTAAHADRNALRQQPVAEPWSGGQTVARDARSNASADAASDRWHEGWTEPAGIVGRPHAASGGATASNAARGNGEVEPSGDGRDRSLDGSEPGAGARTGTGGVTAGVRKLVGSSGVEWGPYEPAIRRWERLTRPAPAPTETGPKGGQRLSPRFTEWMMGWPAGWVTAVPGITRNEALRITGNGVVPQQAVAALSVLLSTAASGVAA